MNLKLLVLEAVVAGSYHFGAIASAGPQLETAVISAEASHGVQVSDAEDVVRRVPKQKEPSKKADLPKDPPPTLPPSAIPGAQNPAEPAPRGDTKPAKPKVPDTTDGHCKGSSDCSKLFDGGKG